MNTHPKVEEYIQKAKLWSTETEVLCSILRSFPLEEDFKWGKPCYTINNSNVVIIQGFKKYLAVMFFKGTLLKDEKQLLVAPGENAQVGRQLRFNNLEELQNLKQTLIDYVTEAIDIEKQGLKVTMNARNELVYPNELKEAFINDPNLQIAFESLTPGRQRQYILYFDGAKQSATKVSRIEKYKDHILALKGMNDN